MKKACLLLMIVLWFFTFGACSSIQPVKIKEDQLSPQSAGELSQIGWADKADDEGSDGEDKQELFFHRPDVKPEKTLIKVLKKQRVLELYGDGKLLGCFKIGLGGEPDGTKTSEGDSKTPEGTYYICTRNDKSRFTLFLGLSYPGNDDAQRGLELGTIGQETYDQIVGAVRNKQQPPWNTSLGGEVGIHGGGNTSDWTLGCIALSDEDIQILWEYAPLKTPVEILK